MAKFKKSNRKKPKFSSGEKRAYWIGVGISTALHGESDKILGHKNAKIARSAQKGYEDDNRRDISSKALQNTPKGR